MPKRDSRDVIGGLSIIGIGLFAVVYAQQYEVGSLSRMGPGFFPIALGVMLIILGVIVFVPAFFSPGTTITVEWKNLFWVITSIILFAVLLKTLGLVLTTVLSVITASMPAKLGWRERLTLSACIALITYLIFSFALGMVLPTWPWSY